MLRGTIRVLWRYSGYLAVLSGHSTATRQRITRQASLCPRSRRGLSVRARAPNPEPQVPYATRCALRCIGRGGTRTSSSSEDASSSRTSPATGTYEYPLSTLAQRGPALPPVATESEHLATRARHVAAQRNRLRCRCCDAGATRCNHAATCCLNEEMIYLRRPQPLGLIRLEDSCSMPGYSHGDMGTLRRTLVDQPEEQRDYKLPVVQRLCVCVRVCVRGCCCCPVCVCACVRACDVASNDCVCARAQVRTHVCVRVCACPVVCVRAGIRVTCRRTAQRSSLLRRGAGSARQAAIAYSDYSHPYSAYLCPNIRAIRTPT